MNLGKLFQKTAYIVVGLAVVVLICLSLYQRHLIKNLSSSPDKEAPAGIESSGDSGKPAEASRKSGKAKGSDPARTGDDLNYQLNAAEEELDMVQNELSDELQKKAELKKNMIEMQKKMFQDPAQRKMIRSSMKAQMEAMYGALFKKLGLSGEKLDQFKELLADQQMAAADLSMEVLDGSISPEKRAELVARQKALESEYKSKIGDFLGEDGNVQYTAYEERMRERQVLTSFFESLSGTETLSETDEQKIIDSLYEARTTAEKNLPFEKKDLLSPADMNETEIAKVMEHTDKVNEGYLNSAAGLLSSSQQEQLKTYLSQQRQMQETALKMTSQMFGSGSGGVQTNEAENKTSE